MDQPTSGDTDEEKCTMALPSNKPTQQEEEANKILSETIRAIERTRDTNELPFFAFGEQTHRSRRNLITGACILLIIALYKVQVSNFEIMGAKISNIDHGVISLLLSFATLYELLIFLSRAQSDFFQWRNKIAKHTGNFFYAPGVNYADISNCLASILTHHPKAREIPGGVNLTKEKMNIDTTLPILKTCLAKFFKLRRFSDGYTKFHFWFFEFGVPVALALISLLVAWPSISFSLPLASPPAANVSLIHTATMQMTPANGIIMSIQTVRGLTFPAGLE